MIAIALDAVLLIMAAVLIMLGYNRRTDERDDDL